MNPKYCFLFALVSLFGCETATGNTPPPKPVASQVKAPPPPEVSPRIYDKELKPKFKLSKSVMNDIVKKQWEKATSGVKRIDRSQLTQEERKELDFLLAWAYLHSSTPEKASELTSSILQITSVPEDYRNWVLGQIRFTEKKHAAAAELLESIPEESPLYIAAQLKAIEAHKQHGNTEKATESLIALSDRPDPAIDGDIILQKRVKGFGNNIVKAYPYLRRLWAYYPATSSGKAAKKRLAKYEKANPKKKPSAAEIAIRSKHLMDASYFITVIKELRPIYSKYPTSSQDGCKIHYAYGRSLFKKNHVTEAAKVLTKVGQNCKELTPDLGARAFYIAGKSQERKGQWLQAAKVYEQIPKLYPEHSMADDGYTLAGISWQESGNQTKALAMWLKQIENYPKGDMLAEGYWRLAWNYYLAGNTPKAIEIAEQSTNNVPLTGDTSHAMALRYWAIRWKIYPDVKNPKQLTEDPQIVQDATGAFVALCNEFPTQFYSLLAAQRLYELAPEKAKKLTRPDWEEKQDYWEVTEDFLNNPKIQRALQLTQIGLPVEAYREVKGFSVTTPTEKAILAVIEDPVNWVYAHDRLHKYLNKNPPSTYTANHRKVLTKAYPNTYWELVQSVTTGYQFDPRIFHALVREESSFNKEAISWAGARGLSQLMPATAKSVAQNKLKMKITLKELFDPEKNLKIGSRYFEYLHDYFRGNSFLAVPGYNAGEGNVGKWLRLKGNLPTDMFIESIPIRETRNYVKRVLGTYQVYRTVLHTDELYPNWSKFNHQAKISKK